MHISKLPIRVTCGRTDTPFGASLSQCPPPDHRLHMAHILVTWRYLLYIHSGTWYGLFGDLKT
jgi:hypothetical protein